MLNKIKIWLEGIIRSILEPLVAKTHADIDAKLRAFDLATTEKLALFDADVRHVTAQAFESTLSTVFNNFRVDCAYCGNRVHRFQYIAHKWTCVDCVMKRRHEGLDIP